MARSAVKRALHNPATQAAGGGSSLALPAISASLKPRFGSSQIDEFVLAHGPTDILRELVQNEFDGGGAQMVIHFDQEMLSITGSGRPISAEDWPRLGVVMGTGDVIGEDGGEKIKPKENGIGSKNFGLRALFAWTDRIHVRSNGRMAIIDAVEAKAGLQEDPASRRRAGVLVQAPYRTSPTRELLPFTPQVEAKAFDDISAVLFPTLVKLALHGRRQGLRRVDVISERTGQSLKWVQEVKKLSCLVEGVTAEHRNGQLTKRGADGAKSTKAYEEAEFSRLIDLPEHFKDRAFPSYYRDEGRVKIAVSLPLKGGKPQTSHIGRFYYPLEARQTRTGCALSISAPFRLNQDRSQLQPGDWNDWLTTQAADLVVELVGSDWFDRYGAKAFEMIATSAPAQDGFQAQVAERLKTAACWPTATAGVFESAGQVVIPIDPVLRGHLSEKRHLHPALMGSPAALSLARRAGVYDFTVNSLVRLRCAGEKNEALATKLKNEADYHFTSWPSGIAGVEFQARAAAALTKLLERLSKHNRKDLAETPTTLTATGALAPAKSLFAVPSDLWDSCPVPMQNRLHPQLLPHRAVSRDCKPFDLRVWVNEAAARAQAGTSSDVEREALYRHLISPGAKLSSPTLSLVRKSPVLKSSDGAWVCAEDLLWPAPRDRDLVARGVPQPAAVLRTKALVQRFRIRQDLKGGDLIDIADAVAGDTEACLAFEGLLRRRMTLVTVRVRQHLEDLAILRNGSGELAAPSTLYLPTPINKACLDDPDQIVEGDDEALYLHLGCRPTPSSTALLIVLKARRTRGEAPPQPAQFYPALVKTLKGERQSLSSFLHEPVLWVDDGYVSPYACLVTRNAPKCLMPAVSIYRAGGPIAEAYLDLGASSLPREQHWRAFFTWIDRRAKLTPGAALPALERVFCRDAYQRASTRMPQDLDSALKWMLSEAGTVHSLSELHAARFLENDFPELADALLAAKAPVAFASENEWARMLFRSLGLKPLSHECGEPRVSVGSAAAAPSWFRETDVLDLLHSEDFAYALAELAAAHQKQAPSFRPARTSDVRRRLLAVKRIRIVQTVTRTYGFLKRVEVPAESALLDDALAIRPPKSAWARDMMLATELTQLVGAKRLPDIRALVQAILPLLHAGSAAARNDYLLRLGIKPRRAATPQEEEAAAREEERRELASSLVNGLVESAQSQLPSPSQPPAAAPPKPAPPPPPTPAPARPPLPSLSEVTLKVSAPNGSAPPAPAPSTAGGWSGRSSGWSPRTPEQVARDGEVGRQGEAIVYGLELERVRATGHADPESVVVWTALADEGADHDIRSIDADGGVIWIEVKSTSGTDGRFDWPRREFEKALREGPRYQLWRVYDAASATPHAKVFIDPIALIKDSVLRLEIGDLRAFVESK